MDEFVSDLDQLRRPIPRSVPALTGASPALLRVPNPFRVRRHLRLGREQLYRWHDSSRRSSCGVGEAM
jgi:hypothetical protein